MRQQRYGGATAATLRRHDIHSNASHRGPVLVTIEYHIRPQDREAFLEAIVKLERARRRRRLCLGYL
jgi:hypothetical protein